MSTAVALLINSLGIIAVAIMVAVLSRWHRQLTNEVTELQAIVDLLLVEQGKRPVFAPRYDLDIEPMPDPPSSGGPTSEV